MQLTAITTVPRLRLREIPVACHDCSLSNRAVALYWAFCRIFSLAKGRDLDLDFHVDENGNERAKGLLYIARKTIQHGYQGRVVCGHCWYAALGPVFPAL